MEATTRYVKTPKGIEEVERKCHGLALKTRQVLIMVDGKRDLAALQGIFPPEMVSPVLAELLSGEFIRELEPPAPVVAEIKPQKEAVNRVPTAANDEERLALARNFMVNTTSAFLGMSGSSLIEKLERAVDLSALAPLYYAWHDAMALTGEGKKRLPELDQQLLKLLGGLPEKETPAAPPAPPPEAPARAAQHRRPANDDERFSMARNFMVNTTTTFIGMAGSALIDKLEQTDSIAGLRHLYFDWRASLQLSKDGLKQLPELEKRLAALLS